MPPAGSDEDAKKWQNHDTTKALGDGNQQYEYSGNGYDNSRGSTDASPSSVSDFARPENSERRSHDREQSLDSHDHNGEEYAALVNQPNAIDEPDNTLASATENGQAKTQNIENSEKVSWASLPRKGQLFLLVLARMSEPLAQNSLAAYVFYQLRSFDPSLPDSTISFQAGILQGSFAAAQFLTAVMWGRISDADWAGRKRVLLIGLLGTTIATTGYGFSRSFTSAIMFRILGGVLNGNVGVLRTMISEIIKEKKFQSRAFILLPMCFNIGVIIGPIIGGCLADPVATYPHIFGPDSILGGKHGVRWMKKWPYALPNLLSAIFLSMSATAVYLGLEETLESRLHKPDYGIRLGKFLKRVFRRIFRRSPSGSADGYSALSRDEQGGVYTGGHARQLSYVSSQRESDSIDLEGLSSSSWSTTTKAGATPSTIGTPRSSHQGRVPARKRKLPFRRIWTRNVLFTLLAHFILGSHLGAFNNLWYTFLSTPRADKSQVQKYHDLPAVKKFFFFTGGLGMPPRSVGMAMAILGFMGILLQLFVYPTINQRLGTMTCYRIFLLLFPVVYALAPYLALVPSTAASESSSSSSYYQSLFSRSQSSVLSRFSSDPQADAEHHHQGPLVWIALSIILFIQVLGRTFTLPATNILVNNCSPHPSVLGTIHGIGQSVSSGARSLGPALGGWAYGLGLRNGIVGAVWWGISGIAIIGWVVSGFVYEGSGHEILLEGEEGEDGDTK